MKEKIKAAAIILTALAISSLFIVAVLDEAYSTYATRKETEQKILTAMSQNTPVVFRNEPVKVIQYDFVTRKVLLRGKVGDFLVRIADPAQPINIPQGTASAANR